MSHSIDFDLEARASPQDAALKAAYNTTVELWTLYSFGVAVTLLRTYARGRAVGLRHMKADDYLIWVAIVRVYQIFKSIVPSFLIQNHRRFSTRRKQPLHTALVMFPMVWQTMA
jgi:hypothetical protein